MDGERTRQRRAEARLGRWAELALATLGYLALLAALIWEGERLADPLPVIVIALTAGTGMVAAGALAGRWWFVAMSPAIAVSLAFGPEPSDADVSLMVVIFVPAAALALAAGVGLGRLARARGRGRYLDAAAVVLAAGVAVPALAAAFDLLRPPRDVTPESPLVVDWREGTLDGIRMGGEAGAVMRAFGPPRERGRDQPASPVEGDYYEIGGPTYFPIPGPPKASAGNLRYEEHALFTTDQLVYGWVTISPRAETPEGVGVGDSRVFVERRYPRANCQIANLGSEGFASTFPLCEVRVCEGRRLFFGGEPIRSVWLIAWDLAGLRECRSPERPKRDVP